MVQLTVIFYGSHHLIVCHKNVKISQFVPVILCKFSF